MDLIGLYRRLEARDQARRLRLPFTLFAFACSLALVLLGAWMLDVYTSDLTTWALIALVLGPLTVSGLVRQLVWRLQRRVDGSR